MKTILLTLVMTAATLTVNAAPAESASHADAAQMCKHMSPESCRLMMREMVKRSDLQRPMAEELSQNPGFEQTWQELHKRQSAHGG